MKALKTLWVLFFVVLKCAPAWAECPPIDVNTLPSLSKAELIPLWCKYMDESNRIFALIIPEESRIGQVARPRSEKSQKYQTEARECKSTADQVLKAFREVTQTRSYPSCMDDKDYAEKSKREYLEKKLPELGLGLNRGYDRLERPGGNMDYGRAIVEPNSVIRISALDHEAGKNDLKKWAPTGANTDKVLRVLCLNPFLQKLTPRGPNMVVQDLMQHGATFVIDFYNEAGAQIGSIPVKGKDCE